MFWVPKEARWSHLQVNAKQPSIGKLIDEAMAAIEVANPGLKGVLPKDYNRPALDKVMLGELITSSPVAPWASKATRRRTSLAAFTNVRSGAVE
jgi:type I restriction-modification system DNA methylase subunit